MTPPPPASMSALMSIFTSVGAYGNFGCGSLFSGLETTTSTSGGTAATQNAVSVSGLVGVEEKAEEQNMEGMLSALMATGVCGAVTQAKIEELERLTGGKDRLLNSASGNLGRYVMGESTI